MAASTIVSSPRSRAVSRGSSTTTTILLEAVRQHQAPAAIILPKVASVIALASIVAGELYGRAFPVVVLASSAPLADHDGLEATITADTSVRIEG